MYVCGGCYPRLVQSTKCYICMYVVGVTLAWYNRLILHSHASCISAVSAIVSSFFFLLSPPYPPSLFTSSQVPSRQGARMPGARGKEQVGGMGDEDPPLARQVRHMYTASHALLVESLRYDPHPWQCELNGTKSMCLLPPLRVPSVLTNIACM